MSTTSRIKGALTLFAFILCACLTARTGFAQSTPSPYTTCNLHNNSGQLTGVIRPSTPDGFLAIRYTYNSAGLVSAVEHGSLSSWQCEDASSTSDAPSSWSGFTVFQTETFGYDSMGRVVWKKTSSGGVLYKLTEYSYDSVGRQQCIAIRMNLSVGPSGNACALSASGSYGPDRITYTTYDPQDHPLAIQRAYGTSVQETYEAIAYTPNGLARTITDANGNRTTMSYDGLDRLVETQFPSKTTRGSSSTTDLEQYTYDADSNRKTLRTRDSQTIQYSYDALDRMTLKQWPNGQSVYYAYDLQNHRLYANIGSAGGQGKLDCGTASGQGVSNCYDGFGNMSSETVNVGGVSATTSDQYDADGDRTQMTYADQNYVKYTYDGLDRLYEVLENGTSLLAQYSYDNEDRLGEIAFGGGVPSTIYGYDGISRLQSLSNTLATARDDVSFSFGDNPDDQIIRRTISNSEYYSLAGSASQTYTPNGLNQYSAVGGTTYSYDGRGNLISDGSRTYQYDIENHLLSASGTGAPNLAYDALGRLHSVTSGSTVTAFVYDGDRIAGEYNSSGGVIRRFVYGRSGDDPIVWYEGSMMNQASRRYLLADHEGSIIAMTDSSGNSVGVNEYDAYGTGNTLNTGRFQYTGQAYIPEIGLYYYKARMYSPALGRFMQTDPVGYNDDVNLYAYVGNDPMGRTDPKGLYTCAGGAMAQCNVLDAALKTAQGALGKMTKKQAATVEAAIKFFGTRNDGNHNVVVTVGKSDMDAIANTSTKDGQTTVTLNPGITTVARLEASAGTSAAGVAVHEGQHGVDDTEMWGGRDPVTNQERYDTERRAFTTESYVERALGYKDSGLYPLNDPSERTNGYSNPAMRAWNEMTGNSWEGVTPW